MRRAALAVAALLLPASAHASCLGAGCAAPPFLARPSLERALTQPNTPCRPTQTFGDPARRGDGALTICAFGTPWAQARRTVALIGDSHAMAWRAAVAGALWRLRWHGLDMTRSRCAFSTTARRYPDRPGETSGCLRFNRRVLAYLTAHPEVTGVFVAHLTGGTPYLHAPGESSATAERVGFRSAWRLLPASVSRIFAIRDNPHFRNPYVVSRCLRAARRERVPFTRACGRPRREALYPDQFVPAARRSSRVTLVDLSATMCDARACHPVVGGVRVTKDGHHLSRLFSTSLGPYVTRAVRRAPAPAPGTTRGARRPARG